MVDTQSAPKPDTTSPDTVSAHQISAVVLAGGRGSRMGGVDKGLQPFNGVSLVAHALQRLQQSGGVSQMYINANRNHATYADIGQPFHAPVLTDALIGGLSDYAGPLAGFLTALQHCQTPYLLTLPCDTPLFPLDLAARLGAALRAQQADIAMVSAPEINALGQPVVRSQPVFCLLKTSLRDSLHAFMSQGGRKIDAWTALHPTVLVPFNTAQDNPLAFSNANTLDELRQLNAHRPSPS